MCKCTKLVTVSAIASFVGELAFVPVVPAAGTPIAEARGTGQAFGVGGAPSAGGEGGQELLSVLACDGFSRHRQPVGDMDDPDTIQACDDQPVAGLPGVLRVGSRLASGRFFGEIP